MNLTLLFQIVSFIGVISFLVTIHELGHYIVAKIFKVKVDEFGLGYPPRVMKIFKFRGTLFSLNAIPFGGFVKMDGEEGPTETQKENEKELTPAERRRRVGPFYEKTKRARLAIIVAGAATNFIFGVLAFSFIFSLKGIPMLAPNARIAEVAADSPAYKAGLKPNTDVKGVQIKESFTNIPNTQALIDIVNQHPGEQITLITTGECKELSCDTTLQESDIYVRTKEETPEGQGALGLRFAPLVIQKFYPWYEIPFRGGWYGLQQAFVLSDLILKSLGQVVTTAIHGQVPKEVAGPVGIFSEARKAGLFSNGALEMLNFTGMLSVNLAIMNLLPIPALDGGRAVFIFIEALFGKKRTQKVEGYLNYGAFTLLLLLTLLITVKDIRQLFIK